MLAHTPKGLYCSIGDFYIDPSRGVERAVVTHAHSDHARRGSQLYYCTQSGADLLRARLGTRISVASYAYRETFYIGPVKVSFHPAGHILGSSQVRLEYAGEVWVVSGDYKREFDPTCEAFEVVPCDVFVTEATFGTPSYAWNKNSHVGKDIFDWWSENAGRGINSLLLAYSLGKTQRILGLLEPWANRPIYCHPAAKEINQCYQSQGVKLAPIQCLQTLNESSILSGDLVIAPPSFLKTESMKILGENYKTAFASGWMARSTYGYDRGFLISDHADWNDLLQTILESQAQRVYVQHRGAGALVRKLRELGLKAFPEEDLVAKNPNQLSLF